MPPMQPAPSSHGGADAQGAVRWDFSTNANAAGPCPEVLAALQAVDMVHYPDASHHALREQLAAWHAVPVWRVLLAASGSEFIQRITAVSQRLAPGAVAMPVHAYGDYARAALACGRAVVRDADVAADAPADEGPHGGADLHVRAHAHADERAEVHAHASEHLGEDEGEGEGAGAGSDKHEDANPTAFTAFTAFTAVTPDTSPPAAPRPPVTLRWCCEPGSPLGRDAAPPASQAGVATVLDAVYAPLRLQGRPLWTAGQRDQAFVLHSPNKALGLTGVRGAYAIAPQDARWLPWVQALNAALPSWPLGAHGVALLQGWASDAAQAWLQQSHTPLRAWRHQQLDGLLTRGIQAAPSVTPFFCVRLAIDAVRLRQHGVLLRDATSFGLPGWWRISVQPPAAQQALLAALDAQR